MHALTIICRCEKITYPKVSQITIYRIRPITFIFEVNEHARVSPTGCTPLPTYTKHTQHKFTSFEKNASITNVDVVRKSDTGMVCQAAIGLEILIFFSK